MMSTSEDEPLSPKGRLRPRRMSAAGPPERSSTARRLEGRVRKEKTNHAKKPSKKAIVESAMIDSIKSSSPPIFKVFCPYCVKKFTSKRSISKHVKRIHHHINSKIGNYIGCQYCSHSEPDPDGIVQHMVSSHPEQYFACLECHTRAGSAAELEAHAPRCDRRKPPVARPAPRRRPPAPTARSPDLTPPLTDGLADNTLSDGSEYNGVVIACELKPSQSNDAADIEDNITTNLILPPSKNLGNSKPGEKNAVIVLDDVQWNKKIAPNLSSFHNSDAEQILTRLGVVHRAPRAGGGDLARKDWQKHLEDTTKFEKCFDTSFYSKVASNVHENLAKFLDGSFNRPLDPESIIKTRRSKNSVVINTSEGFPILLAGEQCARCAFDSYLPRALAPKHKWKWDNPETDKNPMSADQIKRDSHANNCIITLISSLDIWTQLCMRQKFEDKYNNTSFNEKKTDKNNIICNELKEILESREIPNMSGVGIQCPRASTSEHANFPASLGLAPATPRAAPPPAVLSGEWVRPRCYVCCACGEKTHDAKSLSTHISSQHPNAQVSHYDIGGELRLDPEILKHFNVPSSPGQSRSRPLRGIRECTKCKKPVSLEELHQHMLECAGDAPVVKRKCRYRPFGVRRRRPRAPVAGALRTALRKDVCRKTRKNRPRAKVRSEVGDGETIRKMLADLPEKRHRVNVNPLNQGHTSKKRDQTRKSISAKRRGTDEPKLLKTNKQTDRRETKTHIKMVKKEKVKKDSDSSLNIKDLTTSKLRPRLTRSKKVLIKCENSNMKVEINTRLKTRQTKEKPENTDSKSDTKDKKTVLSSVPTEHMSTSNTPQRVNVNSGGSGRQQAARGSRGGGRGASGAGAGVGAGAGAGAGTGERSSRAGNANAPQSAPPLKHSIASLTANTETHDKSVQFQPHFLVNQECYKNIEKTYVPHVFYQDETPAIKLDKPPLAIQNSPDDLFSSQKNKLNKPRKGLNDCIAMLKHKLEDPVPCVLTAQCSVQCDIVEAPLFAPRTPPRPKQPSPLPPSAPALMPPPAPLALQTDDTLYSNIPIPPAHANTSPLSIISTPLDLSGKSSHQQNLNNANDYETLDLSTKSVAEFPDIKDEGDFVVDLSVRSSRPLEAEEVTLDLSTKGGRIKEDLTERHYRAEENNTHGAYSTISYGQNTGPVGIPNTSQSINCLPHHSACDATTTYETDNKRSIFTTPLFLEETANRTPSSVPEASKDYPPARTGAVSFGDAMDSSSRAPMGLPATSPTVTTSSSEIQSEELARYEPSLQSGNSESPVARQTQDLNDNAVASTSTSWEPSSSTETEEAADTERTGNADYSEYTNENVAMLPREIVDILGKMPDNHRKQLLSVLPQYMVQNAAIKQLKLVVDLRPDAIMTPIDSRLTTLKSDIQENPSDPLNPSSNCNKDGKSVETASSTAEKPCPPELLNVDTEKYLIDPVTGAITERTYRESEVLYSQITNNLGIPPNTCEVQIPNDSVKVTSSLADSTQNTKFIAPLTSPDQFKGRKEKTASLRAVRIKTSERRRTQNSSSYVDMLTSAAVEMPVSTSELFLPEKESPALRKELPEISSAQTSTTGNVVKDNNAPIPSHRNSEEDLKTLEPAESDKSFLLQKSQQQNFDLYSKTSDLPQPSSVQSNIEQNNKSINAIISCELSNTNDESRELISIQSENTRTTSTPQPIPSADAVKITETLVTDSILKIETAAEVNVTETEKTQMAQNTKTEEDSEDDVYLADIVKQKLDVQQKTNKSLKTKRNSSKYKRYSENTPKSSQELIPSVTSSLVTSNTSSNDNNSANTFNDKYETKVDTNVNLETSQKMLDSDNEGKKRRSRRNKAHKSYNETDDLFINSDQHDDQVLMKSKTNVCNNPTNPRITKSDNNNDQFKTDSDKFIKIDSELKKQECYETIVIDSQTEESQDNSVDGDENRNTASKMPKASKKTSDLNKKSSSKEVNSDLSPLNNAVFRVIDFETPEDSHYASDSTDHSGRSTTRSARFAKSIKKHSPKPIDLDLISQSSNDTCKLVRRSRRGKSLIIDEPVAANPRVASNMHFDKDGNYLNKAPYTKKQLIFSKLLQDERKSTQQQLERSENNDEAKAKVPRKVLKNHSDPSNELNSPDTQPTNYLDVNEEKTAESQISNKRNKTTKRKKNQQLQKDSKKKKSHVGIASDQSSKEDLDFSTNISSRIDDTVSPIVSNYASIVDENEKPIRDVEIAFEKVTNESDKNITFTIAQQNSLEKIDIDATEAISSGDGITEASDRDTPSLKENKINTIDTIVTGYNVLSCDTVHSSPPLKNTGLCESKAIETNANEYSNKDTKICSIDNFSDTEINNGFLQKFAKPMTCYDIPVAAARTRTKSFLKKSISEEYDPYDIDQEDKLFEKVPSKSTEDSSLEAVSKTSKQLKSSKPSKNKSIRKSDHRKSSLSKSRVETVTSETVSKSNDGHNDSDDSSKSDIPLKKFVSDFAKNSKPRYVSPEPTSSKSNVEKVNEETDYTVYEVTKALDKTIKQKTKRKSSKQESYVVLDAQQLHSMDSDNEQRPNTSTAQKQNQVTDKNQSIDCNYKQIICDKKDESLEVIAVQNVVAKKNKKIDRRAARRNRHAVGREKHEVPIEEPVVKLLDRPDDLLVPEADAQGALVAPDAPDAQVAPAALPGVDPPRENHPLPIENIEMQNVPQEPNERIQVRPQVPNDNAQTKKPTHAQIRSEQFLESFGFFAERQPRKSNLLASKKIAETFHIIETEELRDRKKTSKKNERSKSVINAAPSTSAQSEAPPLAPVIEIHDVPENREVIEIQDVPENQEVVEIQDVPENQEVVEIQEITDKIQEVTENQEVVEIQEVTENQDVVIQEVTENQDVVVIQEAAKKPEPKPVRYCDVCMKVFRRPDNLLRHQLTSLHTNGELEVDSNQEDEEPDYLVLFRHRFEQLRNTREQFNKMKNNGGESSKLRKDNSPMRYDIIAEAKSQTKQIMSSNKTGRRGLSRDEKLFLDCCELLNQCEGGVEGAAAAVQPRPASPAQGPSGLATLKTFDRLLEEDRCDSQSDGDVDSITAQNILESEEVLNLENDLISGLKEAAEQKMASQADVVTETPLEIDPASVVVRAGRKCINCRTFHLFKEFDKQERQRQIELADEIVEVVDVSGDSPEPSPPPSPSPRASPPPSPPALEAPKAPPTAPASALSLPSCSGVSTERKRKKSESMIMEQIDLVDMFEDKFDKIKRKCRSQAAAAKQSATIAEAIKGAKEKKKIEKKKNKKNGKKKLHNAIPTKGALKGFDGIKVSIPTSDIDISALVPNLAGSITDATPCKKRKKNNNKKRRTSNKAETKPRLQCNLDGPSTSAASKVDVYEFSDNDQDLMEFRPSALKGKSKGSARDAPGVAIAVDSSASGSDNDDFVYMSDDYLCSADETENSLLSCETSLGTTHTKLAADAKKSTHKKKDAVDKNAVMGKIFKNNAVRSDTKSSTKTKDIEKSPIANLDQLFDSLLEDEPSSSMLKEDEPLLPATPPPVGRKASGAPVSTPPEAIKKDVTLIGDIKVDLSPQEWLYDNKSNRKNKIDLHSLASDKTKPQKRSKRQSLDRDKEVIERYSQVSTTPRSGNNTPDPTVDRSDLALLDDSGLARHRARRKCAVGKQNVLAETWSSESESDEGFSGRAAGTDAGAARKKRSKKMSSGMLAGARRSRHVTFKQQGDPPGANEAGPSESGLAMPAREERETREARGRSRPEVTYCWSSDEEASGSAVQPPQHGWIVGNSHKKLVTMLAHAKGLKRDEKRQYLE